MVILGALGLQFLAGAATDTLHGAPRSSWVPPCPIAMACLASWSSQTIGTARCKCSSKLFMDGAVSTGPGHRVQWGRTPQITSLFCSDFRSWRVSPFPVADANHETPLRAAPSSGMGTHSWDLWVALGHLMLCRGTKNTVSSFRVP